MFVVDIVVSYVPIAFKACTELNDNIKRCFIITVYMLSRKQREGRLHAIKRLCLCL